MRLPVELYIALKYLLARRKQTFISIITVISVAGVAIGVMALILVLGVMAGFERELKDRILGATAHVHVKNLEGSIADPRGVLRVVRGVEGVVGASPYVFTPMMISSEARTTGGVLRGVDLATVGEVTRLPRDIRLGSLSALAPKRSGDIPGIILGRELAGSLGVTMGDVVEILVPQGSVTPLGAFPGVRSFRVAGLSEAGMYEYDATFAYVSLEEAASMLGMGGNVSGIEVKVDDIYKAGLVAARLRARFLDLGMPSCWADDWMQNNRNLFSALKLEKLVMFIIVILIVMVAAFNIISTLIMVVMEKTRDIAVLMTLGATRRTVRRIFALDGILIGVTGTAVGALLAALLTALQRRFQIVKLPSDVYYISTLPIAFDPAVVLFICGSAVLICFLATLYPSMQAARVDPAEAIRYE